MTAKYIDGYNPTAKELWDMGQDIKRKIAARNADKGDAEHDAPTKGVTKRSTPQPAEQSDTRQLIEQLQTEVAELRSDVARLTRKACDHDNHPEFAGVRVVGPDGVVELGTCPRTGRFGVWLTGRGNCEGLQASMCLDDGTRSTPVQPRVSLIVEGGGDSFIEHSASTHPLTGPETVWQSPLADRSSLSYRHGGYSDGCGGEADIRGSWSAELQLADLTGYGHRTVDVDSLDSVARAAGLGREGKWSHHGQS